MRNLNKYLVEVPHAEDEIPCAHAVLSFLNSGSHLLEHAEWGCQDGVHKCWVILEGETKDDARRVLPPLLRADATIIGLNRFTRDEMEAVVNPVKLATRVC